MNVPRTQITLLLTALLFMAASTGCTPPPPKAKPVLVRGPATIPAPPFDAARMADADRAIDDAIAAGQLPGAVLLVGRGDRTGGRVLYTKAYGDRAVKPDVEPMTPDTIFDLASLTKPVATATSVMVLVDRGLVDVKQPASKYLPEFISKGKDKVTVEHLLLHTSGLIADNAIGDYKDGPAAAWEKICGLPLKTEPGKAFVYSDVGYIVLGKLVERVSGRPLDAFAKAEVFGPLGMTHTTFNPPADWQPTIAPTQQRDGHWMRGEVHDPRAHALGGVAGHAGLFSTAGDVGRFCRMLLGGGYLDGRRILRPDTVGEMIKARPLWEGSPLKRTYGFDSETPYNSPRGERFPLGVSFGHTGFTGTSLWVDPADDCYVVLLANAVHPDGKGKVVALRKKVGTIAGEALMGKASGK